MITKISNKMYNTNYISIIVRGPAHAVDMFHRFCMDEFNHLKDHWRHKYFLREVSATCKHYELRLDRACKLNYFERLCLIFPDLNLYYRSIDGDNEIFHAICQEDGIISEYNVVIEDPYHSVLDFRLSTKDPLIASVFRQNEERLEGQDTLFGIDPNNLQPTSIKVSTDYPNRRLFLVGDSKIIGKRINSITTECFISLLMREDSFKILEMINHLRFRPDKFAFGLTPLMFSVVIGKINEYNLLLTQYPEWLSLTDHNNQSVLHYCIIAGNSDLYDKMVLEINLRNIDLASMTVNIGRLARKYSEIRPGLFTDLLSLDKNI